MGREVRRVPADWEHPKDWQGHYKPLLSGDYAERVAEWKRGYVLWEQGLRLDWKTNEPKPRESDEAGEWWEWAGGPPVREDYMPQWSEAERTHYQMYEKVSEGTPISPVMESPESLARWLAANQGDDGTYEQWLRVCRGGYAPSFIVRNGVIQSGVAGVE